MSGKCDGRLQNWPGIANERPNILAMMEKTNLFSSDFQDPGQCCNVFAINVTSDILLSLMLTAHRTLTDSTRKLVIAAAAW